MAKRRIELTIEISNDQSGMSALRLFLKGLLRSFGIKCIDLRELTDNATDDGDASHET